MESKERIVIRDGKPIYAIRIDNEGDRNKSYVYIKDGKTYFSDSYFSTNNDFDFGNESHRIAKEIFMSELETDIKRRILELKQLEDIFKNLGVKELIKEPIEKQNNKFLEMFKKRESK